MKRHALLVMGLGAALVGCGAQGGGPRAEPLAIALEGVVQPRVDGAGGAVQFGVPQFYAGQSVTVTVDVTGPDGSPVRYTVVRSNDSVIVTPELAPNLTTQPQPYLITISAITASESVSAQEGILVPGLDAPGDNPLINGPAGPDIPAS